MWVRTILAALGRAAALAGIGVVGIMPSHGAAAASARPHIFLIVMENHDWSAIKGSSDAPYINRALLRMGAHAENYFNPPGNHPSLPNYLWLEAGTNFGVQDDGSPAQHPIATSQHLTAILDRHHISWRAYEQGITANTCPLTDRYPYAVRHDPFVYFADITSDWRATSSTCRRHILPLSSLQSNLAAGNVATYTFITPDLCSDMHDSCGPTFNAVLEGDAFLSAVVPLIVRSSAYRANGVILITWDEGEGDDGPIGLIALSPLVRRGFASYRRYTHSSTLRTIEEILGVRPFLGGAATAPDLRALFVRLP